MSSDRREGVLLFERYAAQWGMAIFFESTNRAYGYMPRAHYQFLFGGSVAIDDGSMIYVPEIEFLNRERWSKVLPNFSKELSEALQNPPARTPWLAKLRYRSLLKQQEDLDPNLCKTSRDVHLSRSNLILRWFDSLLPYMSNYELACRTFYPGTIQSSINMLKSSASLIAIRERELGLDRIHHITKALEKFPS